MKSHPNKHSDALPSQKTTVKLGDENEEVDEGDKVDIDASLALAARVDIEVQPEKKSNEADDNKGDNNDDQLLKHHRYVLFGFMCLGSLLYAGATFGWVPGGAPLLPDQWL